MADLKSYSICSLSEDGSCLSSHYTSNTYEKCDQALDKYQNMYPHAVVDIYSKVDLQGLVVHRNDFDYYYL
tara:strand:- start:78 stop:290 length:213 start_codon:yes stop_codon:yes gene_type:complete